MIPDEAVEAAAKYLAEKFNWNGALVPVTAREVLEAAASHLMAAAWDEGYRECYERQMYEPVPTNPYRKPDDAR